MSRRWRNASRRLCIAGSAAGGRRREIPLSSGSGVGVGASPSVILFLPKRRFQTMGHSRITPKHSGSCCKDRTRPWKNPSSPTLLPSERGEGSKPPLLAPTGEGVGGEGTRRLDPRRGGGNNRAAG